MATNYNPKIITSGLVLCLDAANPRSYPGTGTVWKDLSGNGNDGTLINGTSFGNANTGSMIFDGVNDGVNGPLAVGSGPNLSVSLWLKPSNLSSKLLYGVKLDNFTHSLGIFTVPGNGWYWNTGDSSNTPFSSYPNLDNTKWYHITVSNDINENAKLHINGSYYSYAAAKNCTISGSGVKYSLMYLLTVSSYFAGGNVGSFYIHNRALSEYEIKQNFEATRDRYGV